MRDSLHLIGLWKSLAAWLAAVLLVLAAGHAVCAGEQSSDRQFLAGLRRRCLFELAETYCTGRLADSKLPDSRRAELVIELSLTLADRAVNSAPDQRKPLWSRALEVTEDFAVKHPQSAQVLLVRLQGALGLLARGELARQEAQLLARPEALLDEAQTSLGAAVRRLKELAEETDEKLRQRRLPGGFYTRRDAPDRLTVHQLTSLRENIQYQLARAYRNQAQCYQADSPDWANSLTLAVETLDPLAKLDVSHPLAWKSRVDEIVCYRLLADYPTAQRKLDSLGAANPPPPIALRAQAERLRLALAANRLAEAIGMLPGARQLDDVTSGELDYAILETCLAAWSAAEQSNNEPLAAGWQAKANDMVRLIRRQDGPYWTRRAQMLLSGYMRGLSGADLAMQVQAAENAYHSGQYDEACGAYDRASQLAREQGDEAEAFRLGFVAATIEHERGRHEEAMSRYRRLAMSMPGQPKAPQAHLLAIHHAGQIAIGQSAGSLKQYIALAEEHLATWPDAPTADQARRCLAFAREHQGDWAKAVEQYQAISPQAAKFAEVVAAVARCYKAWLEERKTAGKSTAEIASAAAGWFESLIVGPQGRLPEKWSPLDRQSAVWAARFRLDYTTADFGRAEQILSAALEASPDAPPQWQSTARALLVLSLAAQGRRHEAASVLERISPAVPDELLAMLEDLSRVAAAVGPEVRAELAQLQLTAVELLQPERERLSQSGQRDLDRIAAEALADAGRIDEALDAYRRLSKTYPRHGEIQEGYARLLLTRPDRASADEALAVWRQVEERSRPGTDRWFRAKLAVAILHYRSDSRQQAEKIIRLLEVLHPEPRLRDRQVTTRFLESLDPKTKTQLLELLDRCEQPRQ